MCRPQTGVLLLLLANIGATSAPTRGIFRASPGFAQDDSVKSGLVTSPMLDADPPGLRVSWINWDSGFRGVDLRIGDRILAVNGHAIVRPKDLRETQRSLPRMIGQYAESQAWAEQKARDGTVVTLKVSRRSPGGEGAQVVEVRGALRAERLYVNKSNANTLGPGGPVGRSSDGFSSPWSGWYEAEVFRATRVLDGGWQSRSLDSRRMLKEHLAEKERVDFLLKTYPGTFASTVKEDWDLVRTSLEGKRYELGEKDLAYRQLGEQRAAEIATAGRKAREEFLRAGAAQRIEPFPAIDPIRGDREKVAGKVVLLPPIPPRDWVMDGPKAYLFSGDRDRGFYFVDTRDPGIARVFEACYRYKKRVTPRLDETYTIVGRIRAEPKMLVIQNKAQTGLAVEVLAAAVGEAMFVDATVIKDKISAFAGEEALRKPPDTRLTREASPRQVMEVFIAALKEGDEETWKGLFAPWRAIGSGTGKIQDIVYYPYRRLLLDEPFVASRRLILDRVHDVRVVYVSEVRRIITGKEFDGAPVVEEVMVELEHVGKFENEYRAFTSVAVNRIWPLQRVDGGPWRIADPQQL
ncbi:MAG: hypothetical protein HYY17_10955 [Planctomycetes bacterium]|nr:hypothetical protein [Planctomycetota bacterium]